LLDLNQSTLALTNQMPWKRVVAPPAYISRPGTGPWLGDHCISVWHCSDTTMIVPQKHLVLQRIFHQIRSKELFAGK